LIQVAFFGLLLIFLPVIFRPKTNQLKTKPGSFSQAFLLLLFACLGLGFMLVEVSIIQKSILLFENPHLAIATVLAAILTGSGCGSLVSSRYPRLQNPITLLIIPGVIVIYILVLPRVPDFIAPLTFYLKSGLGFVLFIPMGFFMGIPFPAAIKFLGEKQKNLIPWAWAVNGSFSVMAPILAIQIALSHGFAVVLGLGAFAYILAFFIFHVCKKSRL
jgi:hypothetical protein